MTSSLAMYARALADEWDEDAAKVEAFRDGLVDEPGCGKDSQFYSDKSVIIMLHRRDAAMLRALTELPEGLLPVEAVKKAHLDMLEDQMELQLSLRPDDDTGDMGTTDAD